MTPEASKALADECDRVAAFPIGQMPIYSTQGLLKKVAAALRSQPVTLAREEVARCIWIKTKNYAPTDDELHRSVHGREFLDLADAILALTPSHEAGTQDDATYKIGRWLSAALDDPQVCQEMKNNILAWMEAGKPNVQPSVGTQEPVAKATLAYQSTNHIAACRCGSFPTLYGDGARPDDGYRSLWCQTCMVHVTEMMRSEREVIDHWNELREQEHAALYAAPASQDATREALRPKASSRSDREKAQT